MEEDGAVGLGHEDEAGDPDETDEDAAYGLYPSPADGDADKPTQHWAHDCCFESVECFLRRRGTDAHIHGE